MAWRMALPPEKQSEQEDFDDALLAKSGIDMETEADLLRYEARGGSVLTHVFAVHDIRTRYRIHQKWHRGCPRLYGPARTLLYLDDLRDYFGEKVSAFYTATTSTTSTTSTTITTTTSTTTVPTAATTHPPPPPLPPLVLRWPSTSPSWIIIPAGSRTPRRPRSSSSSSKWSPSRTCAIRTARRRRGW